MCAAHAEFVQWMTPSLSHPPGAPPFWLRPLSERPIDIAFSGCVTLSLPSTRPAEMLAASLLPMLPSIIGRFVLCQDRTWRRKMLTCSCRSIEPTNWGLAKPEDESQYLDQLYALHRSACAGELTAPTHAACCPVVQQDP